MSSVSWGTVRTLSDRAMGLLEEADPFAREGGEYRIIDDAEVRRVAGVVVQAAKSQGEIAEELLLDMLLEQVRSELWDLLHDEAVELLPAELL